MHSRYRNGRDGRPHRKSARKPSPAAGTRCLVQLVVCGLLFAGLVGVKLLLPDRIGTIDEELRTLLQRNMDLKEVFSVVGEIAAGKKSGSELAQAVFGTGASVPAEQESVGLPAESQGGATEDEADRAIIQYTQQNLPENVSMEQTILGFDYCTPVRGTLTSGFGYRRHPAAETLRFHYGIDLAAEHGTEISCFADGTVKAVGESSSYGNYCIVEHEGGFETLYAHCRSITVPADSEVKCGEKLGEVGDSGLATGSHLHFELHQDGVYLNPIYYVEA